MEQKGGCVEVGEKVLRRLVLQSQLPDHRVDISENRQHPATDLVVACD